MRSKVLTARRLTPHRWLWLHLILSGFGVGCEPGSVLPDENRVDSSEPYRPSAAFPFGRRNPDAPPELEQYAFMIGIFDCDIAYAQYRDGSWETEREGRAVWRAEYIMNGHAILDEFRDQWGSKNVNVRIYSRSAGYWYVHWTAVDPDTGAVFVARESSAAMVMESAQRTPDGFGYVQRVSLRGTQPDHYEWSSEIVYPDGESVLIGSIYCTRR